MSAVVCGQNGEQGKYVAEFYTVAKTAYTYA